MDNHVRNAYVHLAGAADIRTVEVGQPAPQKDLGGVHARVLPHLYHSVVDLLYVQLVDHFLRRFAARAALARLWVAELFAVGRCIQHVEDVAQHGGAWHFHPIQRCARLQKAVMGSLRLVSAAVSSQFPNIVDGIEGVSEILVLNDVGVSVVPIGHNGESEGDALGPYFVLDALDNGHDG